MAEAGLYREVLLDHARHPRHAGRLDRPDLTGSAHNPLCGDQLEVTVALDGQSIRDIRGAVRGCVIAQASCSLMTELVMGKPLAEALADGEALGRALGGVSGGLPADGSRGLPDDASGGPQEGGASGLPDRLAALAPLVEVRQHRSRIGCALLPWQALAAARKG